MTRTTHLNALQALEMAIREGSLQAAAERLGITPAAVGQRIRALEQDSAPGRGVGAPTFGEVRV